jgi:TfoX/Sxy family transcriptional regulator of competence genes
VPIEVLEDRDELEHWLDAALKAAQRVKKVKKPKKASEK